MKSILVLILIAFPLAGQTWKDYLAAGRKSLRSGDLTRAELLFARGAEETAKFGENDPRHGASLGLLGSVLRTEHKLAEAQSVFERSLLIAQVNYGPQSLDAGNVQLSLAEVEADLGRCAEAIPIYAKALPVFEKWFGADGAKTARVIHDTGDCERKEGRFPQAESLLRRAAALREANEGVDSPELAETLHSLALTYTAEDKLSQADGAFRLALVIREKDLGLTSSPVRETLQAYSGMLRKAGRSREAAGMSALAQAGTLR